MGYDRGDTFTFDFEPNEIPFGSKSNEKLSPRSYPIQCESKWKYSFHSESHLTFLVLNPFQSARPIVNELTPLIAFA